jgi:hypothetical protein
VAFHLGDAPLEGGGGGSGLGHGSLVL